MKRLETAQNRFTALFDELSEFKNPKLLEIQAQREEEALAKSKEANEGQEASETPPLPMNLFAQVKLFLDRAVREQALIKSAVEEHERLVVGFESEHAAVLGDLTNYQAPKAGAEAELEDLLEQTKELEKAQEELIQTNSNAEPFFEKLSLLRQQALKARDAYKALLAELDLLESAKEGVRLREEEVATAKRFN